MGVHGEYVFMIASFKAPDIRGLDVHSTTKTGWHLYAPATQRSLELGLMAISDSAQPASVVQVPVPREGRGSIRRNWPANITRHVRMRPGFVPQFRKLWTDAPGGPFQHQTVLAVCSTAAVGLIIAPSVAMTTGESVALAASGRGHVYQLFSIQHRGSNRSLRGVIIIIIIIIIAHGVPR